MHKVKQDFFYYILKQNISTAFPLADYDIVLFPQRYRDNVEKKTPRL